MRWHWRWKFNLPWLPMQCAPDSQTSSHPASSVLLSDCMQAKPPTADAIIRLIRSRRGGRRHHFPQLQIDGIAPAEADLVALVPRSYLHIRISGDHVVLFADRPIGGKALVDCGVELARDAARILAKAHGFKPCDS